MGSQRIPDGYLEFCSIDALESLVLSRMNRAANLRGESAQLIRRWIEAEADVKVAQWMLESRRSQLLRCGAAVELRRVFPGSGKVDFLALPVSSAPEGCVNFPAAIAKETAPLPGSCAATDVDRTSPRRAKPGRHSKLRKAQSRVRTVLRRYPETRLLAYGSPTMRTTESSVFDPDAALRSGTFDT